MQRRITFISRGDELREWESTDRSSTRVICVEPLKVLCYALTAAEDHLDIERVVLDGGASASEYLDILAALPHDVTADVMMLREDGTAFLSAIARAGSRVLYSLSAKDVEFYLQMHGLIVYDNVVQMTA
jgi:hypothetical protein